MINKYFIDIDKELKYRDDHIIMKCLSIRRKQIYFIKVRCMRCGETKIIRYNNYKTVFEKKRIINDNQEITNVYLCNNCVKTLVVSNTSTRKKLSIASNKRSKESKIKSYSWMFDLKRKKIAIDKQRETRLRKYGCFSPAEFNKKRLETKKRNFLVSINKLKARIINGEEVEFINTLIFKALIRETLNVKGFYNEFFWEYSKRILRQEKFKNYEIVKVDQIDRSIWMVKRGWIHINKKLMRFDSQLELSFILWKFSEDKNIEKNLDRFKYLYNNEIRNYTPDFYDLIKKKYYEIKDYRNYVKNKKLIDKKLLTCNAKLILDTQIPRQFKILAKIEIDNFFKSNNYLVFENYDNKEKRKINKLKRTNHNLKMWINRRKTDELEDYKQDNLCRS